MTDETLSEAHDGRTWSNPSRALVTTVSRLPAEVTTDRPLASFVTQLIACNRRLPAYRSAVRAEPDTARRVYLGETGPTPRQFDRVI